MGLEERQQVREIDGVNYQVCPLPFGIGQKALMRTLRIVAPIAGAALKSDGDKKINVSAALEALPLSLSDEDVSYFSSVFGAQSKYQDGDKWVPLVTQNQELHFAGRYLAFVRWIAFSMEVNFAGFFSGLTGAANGADAQTMLAAMAKRV